MRRSALSAALFLTALGACSAKYPTAPEPTLAAVRIHVTAVVSELLPNSTATFIAYAIDSDGVYVDVTTRAQWSSSNSDVLTAGTFQNNRAVVRGVTRGDANLNVSYQGQTDSVTLRVLSTLPVPRLNLSVSGVDLHPTGLPSQSNITVQYATQRGFQTVTTAATITSSDPSIVTIEGTTLRPFVPGTVRLTAAYDGFTDTALISVQPSQTIRRP